MLGTSSLPELSYYLLVCLLAFCVPWLCQAVSLDIVIIDVSWGLILNSPPEMSIGLHG